MSTRTRMHIHEMQALLDRGDHGEVIERLEGVVREAPLYGAAQIMLAEAYEGSDHDLRTVLQAWARASQVAPGSEKARRGLARSLSSWGPRTYEIDDASDDDVHFEYENLDSLITELETARIEPSADLDSIPEPDLDDDLDDMVSPTLARIYAAQDQYKESARVYRKLADQDSSRADEYLQKAAEMDEKVATQSDEAAS